MNRPKGFSLVEIVIVIALIGTVYVIAMPQWGVQSAAETSATLGRLSGDFRSAFDLAVLSGKPYRMVFKLSSGEYWLESLEGELDGAFTLGQEGIPSDPSKEEQEAQIQRFEDDFAQYKELGEQTVSHPTKDEKITGSSPVLEAKNQLKPKKWTQYQSSEWSKRTIGPGLGFRAIYAEHHMGPQVLEDPQGQEELLAFIYILPQGYLEKATLYIYPRLNSKTLDMDSNPYRVVTLSYQGEARVESVSKDNLDFNRLEGL
jgi:prepilin-type N-terminal cleavage/methylation domain-containing protein